MEAAAVINSTIEIIIYSHYSSRISLIIILQLPLSMPPKAAGKKEAQAKPDNSGIPKVDAEFKFVLTVKSDSPEAPAYGVMFQWFGSMSDKLERLETGLIEGWKKDQSNYTFEKECDPIRIDDDFCKNITSKQFYLYFVNSEDNKVEHSLLLDYSCLLTPTYPPSFSFESNTIRAMGVDSFTLKLTADKALLLDLYRQYLNPLQVEVVGAKDLPVEKSSRYEPAYVKYSLFDGPSVCTHPLVGSDKLVWSHKHVFLAGLMDANKLKEQMRSKYLKFQMHDRDEVNNRKVKPDVELFDVTRAIQEQLEREKPVEEDPKKKGAAKKEEKKQVKKQTKKDPKKKDAKLGQPILPPAADILKNNYGVSAFSLVQFLKPSMRTARYKAAVVPKNAFQDFESRNVDLNTTARNQMQKVLASSNYFDCDTVLVVGFTLACPIGQFKKPEIKEEAVVEDPKKKKEAPKQIPKQAPKEEKPKAGAVFQRIVYIVPYADKDIVAKIEGVFYEANLKAFGMKSKRELTTYLLKKQEKENAQLDYVTGLQIVDPEGRIYIFEGLKGKAMDKFHKAIVREGPNRKEFKLFQNTNLQFSQRLFADFNIEIKRMRLRPNLSQLLLEPSIYIKSKVPEQICLNLNRLADIRRTCDDLFTVDSLNLWPNSEALLQIQRKFTQALTNLDITGQETGAKKDKMGETIEGKTIKLLEQTDLKVVTADQFFLPKIQQSTTQIMGETSPSTLQKRLVMTKTFTKDEGKLVQTYQMRGKVADVPSDEPVYIYAGQKNNWYQQRLNQVRAQMQRNPKVIYTYDKEHFNLAIEPYTLQEQRKKEHQLSQSQMAAEKPFSSLLIRTKDERMRLPKRPGDEDIQNLKEYPYHDQKKREKEMKKNTRDAPPGNSQTDFKKYLRPQEIFSQFPVAEGEVLSPVEKEKLQKEEKKRHQEEEKAKMKGDPVIHHKKGYFADKSYGVDRFKDIREGEAKKLGIVDVRKQSREKRPIADYQVSYNLKEQPIDPSYNPLIRRDNDSLNLQKEEFNFYQGPQVLTRTQIYKPLKDIL